MSDESPDHAELRDGETPDDSHAARNAAALAALTEALDDDSEER